MGIKRERSLFDVHHHCLDHLIFFSSIFKYNKLFSAQNDSQDGILDNPKIHRKYHI